MRRTHAVGLKEQAKELLGKTRLEDLTVREEPLVKQTKKGERKEYFRWVASWWEGDRYRKVYLGSCRKMSRDEALERARAKKAEEIGIL